MLQYLYNFFTPVQLATLSLLLLFFVIELIYLLFFYNRVSLFAGRAAAGRVGYAQELPSVSVVWRNTFLMTACPVSSAMPWRYR